MRQTTKSKSEQYRSAKTGQYITYQYAKTHPATTVSESTPKVKGKK
jgi:hypothetical protein